MNPVTPRPAVNTLRPDLARIASWIEPGSRVLDLGCGDGALLAPAAISAWSTIRQSTPCSDRSRNTPAPLTPAPTINVEKCRPANAAGRA